MKYFLGIALLASTSFIPVIAGDEEKFLIEHGIVSPDSMGRDRRISDETMRGATSPSSRRSFIEIAARSALWARRPVTFADITEDDDVLCAEGKTRNRKAQSSAFSAKDLRSHEKSVRNRPRPTTLFRGDKR